MRQSDCENGRMKSGLLSQRIELIFSLYLQKTNAGRYKMEHME